MGTKLNAEKSVDRLCDALETATSAVWGAQASEPKMLEAALKAHMKEEGATQLDNTRRERLLKSTHAFLGKLAEPPPDFSILTHSKEFRKWATCVPALVQINGFPQHLVRKTLAACESGLALRTVFKDSDNEDGVENGELVSRSILQSVCTRMLNSPSCSEASVTAALDFISSHLIFASSNFVLLNIFCRVQVRLCAHMCYISRKEKWTAFLSAYRSAVTLLRMAASYTSKIGSVLRESGINDVPVQQRYHSDNFQVMKVVKFILEHVHQIVKTLQFHESLCTKLVEALFEISAKLSVLRVSGPEYDSDEQGKTAFELVTTDIVRLLSTVFQSIATGNVTCGHTGNNKDCSNFAAARTTIAINNYLCSLALEKFDSSHACACLLLVTSSLRSTIKEVANVQEADLLVWNLENSMPALTALIHRAQSFLRISSFERVQMESRGLDANEKQGYLCAPNQVLEECCRLLQDIGFLQCLGQTVNVTTTSPHGALLWIKLLTHESAMVRLLSGNAFQNILLANNLKLGRNSPDYLRKWNKSILCFMRTICAFGSSFVKQIVPSVRQVAIASVLLYKDTSDVNEGVISNYLNEIQCEKPPLGMDCWNSTQTERVLLLSTGLDGGGFAVQYTNDLLKQMSISHSTDKLASIAHLRPSLSILLTDQSSVKALQESNAFANLAAILAACYRSYEEVQSGTEWFLCTEAVRFVVLLARYRCLPSAQDQAISTLQTMAKSLIQKTFFPSSEGSLWVRVADTAAEGNGSGALKGLQKIVQEV